MNRFPILRVILAGMAIPFAGCQSGTGSSTEHQPTGLYRCIGESEYAPGELEKIMRDLKAQSPECPDHGSVPARSGPIAPASGDIGPVADSMRVHTVVLDERCNLVSEKEMKVPEKNRHADLMDVWNMGRDDGAPAETGIYYINVASERADGSRDTGYVKVGMVRDPCVR